MEGKIGDISGKMRRVVTVKQAAGLINEIKPDVAIPVHYGSVIGGKRDEETFIENVKEPTKVEVKIKL